MFAPYPGNIRGRTPSPWTSSSWAGYCHIRAFILFGFFLQVALDNFSGGLEHGHAHYTTGPMPLGMIGGLCVHAFLEAMPLVHMAPPRLLAAIVVHKFPVTIVLLTMLLHNSRTTKNACLALAVFALMEPMGH